MGTNLEEAILKFKEIITGAMAAENKWLYLVAHLKELVAAGQVIVTFAMGLFVEENRVMLTDGVEAAGTELRLALTDVLEEADKPQLGPAMWISIAMMIIKLLAAIDRKRN